MLSISKIEDVPEAEADSSSRTTTNQRQLEPLEYSSYLDRADLSSLIRRKMDAPSLEQRWLKCLETLDLERIEEFKKKFKNVPNTKELVNNNDFVILLSNLIRAKCQNFQSKLANRRFLTTLKIKKLNIIDSRFSMKI